MFNTKKFSIVPIAIAASLLATMAIPSPIEAGRYKCGGNIYGESDKHSRSASLLKFSDYANMKEEYDNNERNAVGRVYASYYGEKYIEIIITSDIKPTAEQFAVTALKEQLELANKALNRIVEWTWTVKNFKREEVE